MRIALSILLSCLFLATIGITSAEGQQRFPVTVSTSLTPPYSPYVSDYISVGSSLLRCNFVFNDFKEPSWQVRLKIRIESTDLKLETRPDFRPAAPITVVPGISVPLSGVDFAEYFDFKNLTILGSAANGFLQNGRFNEGSYTFCIEVLDYQTGRVLSNTSCTTAWIRLNDPPKVISPLCGSFIDPTLPLNIPFQWQLSNAISPNSTQGIEFKVVVYELTDPHANPFTAIANGKVLQVFESDALTQPSFTYTPASPALDVGKAYIYQIRARDVGGRDLFKNNGLSEVCWFHYGYPENAKLTYTAPENEKAYRKADRPYFRWSAPDLRIRNQPFIYELKIVALQAGQTPEEGIRSNAAWHTERTTQTVSDKGMDLILKKALDPGSIYAWQITTYSGNQTVARGEIRSFIGPPLVEYFYAGRHIVVVKRSTSNDSLNFAGMGTVRVGTKDSAEVSFSALKLKSIGSYWVLTAGEITKELPGAEPISLQPRNQLNGVAAFYPRALRLTSTELAMQGEVKWALPHATKSGGVAYVTSERVWLNYDKYKLLGAAKLNSKNKFELLEPYDFLLDLNEESDFLISGNEFELRVQGEIVLPEKIKGKQKGKTKVPFPRTGQLFYIKSLPVIMENDVALVDNTRIYLKPTLVTIDLSEQVSPGNLEHNAAWKGIYIHTFDIHYNSFTDQYAQLKFGRDVVQTFSGDEAAQANAWFDGRGVNLTLTKDFGKEGIVFNSFAGITNRLELTVEKSKVTAGQLMGGILIPVFSGTDYFDFTVPITNEGFRPGYLNAIEGKSFLFNKGGGEQEVSITLKRGVFAEQRLLDMVIDLAWPALSVTANAVSGFRVWGDYNIGFYRPNGARALDQQLEGSLSGYTITIDAIAAGSNAGLYSFAISAKALLGDDVSGDSGPPSINVYSIVPSELAPKTVLPDAPDYATQQQSSQAVIQSVQSEYGAVGSNLKDKLDASEQEIKDKTNQALQNLTSRQPVVVSVNDVAGDIKPATPGDLQLTPAKGGLLQRLNPRQQEIVKEVVELVILELTKPVTNAIDAKAQSVIKRIDAEIDEIILLAQKQVSDKVTSLVNTVAIQVIQTTKNDKVDLSQPIMNLAEVVIQSVTQEVNTSIEASITKNIAQPITSLIRDDIAGSINIYIREATVKIVIESLEGKITLEQVPQNLVEGADTLLHTIADKVFDKINFSSLSSMVYNTANDALRGINTDRILNEIKAGATSILRNTINDKVNELASNAASNLLNDAIGIQIPINFTGIVGKIKDGNVKDIFALDPVAVKLRTKVLDLNGLIHYQNDEPTYGDVWLGSIDVNVKVPKPFTLNAIYINGKVNGYSYWFAQITPGAGESVKLGGVIPRDAKPLSKPINMGPAKIMAVSGRIYHNMKDIPGRPIVPDNTINYGAYLNLVFFDQKKSGKAMRLNVAGEINTAYNGDYVITFEGDIQIMNEVPEIHKIDPQAAITGAFRFSYNSAEEHFLGYGRIELKKPGKLCAAATVLVDTKPGKWRVEIGSRDDRVIFIPACAGWSPTGWLSVTESEAELGLGVQYSIYAQTPTINFIVVKANVALDAGVAFGIQAAIRYQPDFALLRAGVWADLWADVLINYKFIGSGWKRFSILSIYAKGDLMIFFVPKPSKLEGNLKGTVRLLSIVTIKFDTGFKATL